MNVRKLHDLLAIKKEQRRDAGGQKLLDVLIPVFREELIRDTIAKHFKGLSNPPIFDMPGAMGPVLLFDPISRLSKDKLYARAFMFCYSMVDGPSKKVVIAALAPRRVRPKFPVEG